MFVFICVCMWFPCVFMCVVRMYVCCMFSPAARTEEDIELIYEELLHIRALRHLSNAVKRQISACANLEYVKKSGKYCKLICVCMCMCVCVCVFHRVCNTVTVSWFGGLHLMKLS